MKIFFSLSVAALLGFATVGSSVQAQSDLRQLWSGPDHLNRSVQEEAQQVAGLQNAAPQMPVSLIKKDQTLTVLDSPPKTSSGVPYFYGGESNPTPAAVDSASTAAAPCPACLTNAYSSGMSAPWGGQGRNLGTGLLGGGNAGQAPWFGGLNGLIFFRDDADEVWLSYPAGDPTNRAMTTRSVDADPFGGVEVNLGRYMNNGYAWMATYWGLFAEQDSCACVGAPQVALPTLDLLNYNGDTVENLMNASAAQRVTVQNQFHNFEFNLLNATCCNGMCNASARRFNFLAGFRYFKYNDNFHFGNAFDANNFGGNVNDLCYEINTENNLFGFQLGGMGNLALSDRWTFRAGTKLGVYGNHITYDSRIFGWLGDATTGTGQAFNVNNTKDDVAFLGEFDLGLVRSITQRWSANFGYRAVAVTGLAHTSDQIPNNFADLGGVSQIDSNGSLILHGIYMGALYNF